MLEGWSEKGEGAGLETGLGRPVGPSYAGPRRPGRGL